MTSKTRKNNSTEEEGKYVKKKDNLLIWILGQSVGAKGSASESVLAPSRTHFNFQI